MQQRIAGLEGLERAFNHYEDACLSVEPAKALATQLAIQQFHLLFPASRPRRIAGYDGTNPQ